MFGTKVGLENRSPADAHQMIRRVGPSHCWWAIRDWIKAFKLKDTSDLVFPQNSHQCINSQCGLGLIFTFQRLFLKLFLKFSFKCNTISWQWHRRDRYRALSCSNKRAQQLSAAPTKKLPRKSRDERVRSWKWSFGNNAERGPHPAVAKKHVRQSYTSSMKDCH